MDQKAVVIYKDEARAGTFLIAQGFNREHIKLVSLIEKYRDRFEKFSPLPAERIKTKGRPVDQLLLDEDQTMFLGSLLRNTEVVLNFKEKIIHQFKKCRKQLERINHQKYDPDYQIVRDAGKIVRKDTTDIMKEFIVYAESQGSKSANRYYMNITRMMNGLLFIVEGKFKNLRDVLSIHQLMTVSSAESIIEKGLIDGMKRKMFYKEIYQDIKKKVMIFAELHGQSEVIDKQLMID